MKLNLLLILSLLSSSFFYAQVGINNTDPKASLDITATNQVNPSNTDGILIPRIDDFPATNPTAAQQGMLVYLTTTSGANLPGFYYWDNNAGPATWASVSGNSNTLDQAYDESGAGAGSLIYAYDGAVTIGGHDGLLVTGSTNNGDTAISGAGVRMFFNPRKAAFRAGGVTGTKWNDTNIGIYSTALTKDSEASGAYSTAIGQLSKAAGSNSIAIGASTVANASHSFSIGYDAIANGEYSTVMGNSTNSSSFSEFVIGRYNTLLGGNASTWDINDPLFIIGNGINTSNRSNALTIYKNGLMNINDEYNMPLTDGNPNFILQTNGSGQVSFVDPATIGDGTGTDNQNLTGAILTGTSLQIDIENGSSTSVDLVSLQDGIGATKINELIDGKSDDDGTDNGSSIFLGINAGLNDDGNGNNNLGIGFETLKNNTNGHHNTAIGFRALFLQTVGYGNTAIGTHSLYQNYVGNSNTAIGQSAGILNSGSLNIFLGYNSGFYETGSNKLYIESSNGDANNALIYGEFDTNILRINGELQLGNTAATRYKMPTADGSTNYILQTNGSGQVSFVNPSSIGVSKIDELTDGKSDATGSTIFLGNNAGAIDDGSANNNIGIGLNSLLANTSGGNNIAIGVNALDSNINANFNIAIGTNALNSTTNNGQNLALGYFSMASTVDGNSNVALGHNALTANISGDNNVVLGHGAGSQNNGSGNIFIGKNAGNQELTASNKLYIDNSGTGTPLIYGDFSSNDIGINWNSATALPNTLSVNGNASKSTAGSWLANSDQRLKKEIQTIDGKDALKKINKLRGVIYKWNDDKTGINRPTEMQYGFIAQELMEVFPSKVSLDKLGYYQTAYGDYDPIFVEAIKEIDQRVKKLTEQNKEQKKEIEKLRVQLLLYGDLVARLKILEAKKP